MPPSRMIVNGVDLATFGIWADTPQGWADGPTRQDKLVDLQGAGSAVITTASRLTERRFSVAGTLTAATRDDALDLWDAAKAHLMGPWLELVLAAVPDRMAVCRLQRMTWQGINLEMAGWRLTLEFLSPSPYLVAPIVDMVGLTAGVSQPIALGTAPSPFLVEFQGPATPSLTYYDAQGTVQGQIRLLGPLADREWMRFDSQTLELQRHGLAGSVTNGAPYFAGDSRLFQLDPADGTPDQGPSLLLDEGSAVVYIRKAWL